MTTAAIVLLVLLVACAVAFVVLCVLTLRAPHETPEAPSMGDELDAIVIDFPVRARSGGGFTNGGAA